MALQMLFQRDLGASALPEVLTSFDPEDYLRQLGAEAEESAQSEDPPVPPPARHAPRPEEIQDAFGYASRLVEGVESHREEIDERIRAQAENWRLERMPSVDRNILRLAIYEMWHQNDVPKLVVLDEAVELAKRFGSEQSGRFVNGVLDGLMKSEPIPGSLR
jgi:transcription antitermination protein NusB